jgi:hypothetical protein
VNYVRTLEYGDNVLFIGPMLMARHFDRSDILSWELNFNGKEILFGNKPILGVYPEFVKEFTDTSITTYYMEAWAYRKAYSLISLPSKKTHELTRSFHLHFMTNLQRIHDELYFQLTGEYVQENGMYFPSDQPIRMCKVNITDNYDFIGGVEYIEDPIKTGTVFSNEGSIYHLVSDSNTYHMRGPLNIDVSSTFKLKTTEQFWSMVLYKHEIHFVYEWYPLILTRIIDGVLTPLPPTYVTPRFFKEMAAATHMVQFNGQFWGILTKTHHFVFEHSFKKYAHVFVVFDQHMKLIKYSEFFIMDQSSVSKISDLQINETFTISYTTHHGRCFISEYSYQDIQKMRWTYH